MSQDMTSQPKPRSRGHRLLWVILCLLIVTGGGLAVHRWLNPRLVPVTRLVLPERHIFLYNDCYGFPAAYIKYESSGDTLWLLNEHGQTRGKTDLSIYLSSPPSDIPGFLQRLFYNYTPRAFFEDKEHKLVIEERLPLYIIIRKRGQPDTKVSSRRDPWLFSQDGTVWKESGGKLHLLKWRSGKPSLTAMATPIVPDDHVLDFSRLPRRSV